MNDIKARIELLELASASIWETINKRKLKASTLDSFFDKLILIERQIFDYKQLIK